MQLEDRFYTSTEVAEILGVSLRSVYRYLEEGKINAEIKTATGRHRFTRKNILDFLYPEGTPDTSKPRIEEVPARQAETPVEKVPEFSASAEPVEDGEEKEEVDWLAKFRAAAQKHRQQIQEEEKEITEEPQVEPEPIENEKFDVGPVSQPTPVQAPPSIDSLSSLAESDVEAEPEPEEVKGIYYYTSSISGLKELAQYVNKSAKKSNVPYAFTMNAGLSLHKLIRPFSLLHIYSREQDRLFFEKALELTPSEQSSAQLAIMIDRSGVLKNTREVHGLTVVSNNQLKQDLLNAGEVDLARELDTLG